MRLKSSLDSPLQIAPIRAILFLLLYLLLLIVASEQKIVAQAINEQYPLRQLPGLSPHEVGGGILWVDESHIYKWFIGLMPATDENKALVATIYSAHLVWQLIKTDVENK